MSCTIDDQLHMLDRTTLAPLVQQALGCPEAKMGDWQCQRIYGGAEATSSVYRFCGEALANNSAVPWSLVLKVVQGQPGVNADPQGVSYWKREALAYQSGLLSDLPGGFVAPRCYAAVEQPGRAYWIWMEDIRADPGSDWRLEQYGTVARCLGRFNGAYLAGNPRLLPSYPWLSRRWLRQYIEQAAPVVAHLPDLMRHPLVRRALAGLSAETLQRRWDERHAILEALEGLPQTFCHLDAFHRNLFPRHTAGGASQVVAVDWSFTGSAALGEELGPLIAGALGFYTVSASDARRLEALVLDGYLAGLAETGWRGEPDQVRFGYAATMYWRYPLGGRLGEVVPALLDEGNYAGIERTFGHGIEQVADDIGALLDFDQYVYEQAHRLKTTLTAATRSAAQE